MGLSHSPSPGFQRIKYLQPCSEFIKQWQQTPRGSRHLTSSHFFYRRPNLLSWEKTMMGEEIRFLLVLPMAFIFPISCPPGILVFLNSARCFSWLPSTRAPCCPCPSMPFLEDYRQSFLLRLWDITLMRAIAFMSFGCRLVFL